MKSPEISVVLPYLSTSRCIARCKELLKQNTTHSYEIAEIVDCRQVWQAFNTAAEKAKGKILVFLNDDMFVAPGWDELIPTYATEKKVVTTYLIEPGRLPVNHRNLFQDFGRTPEDFDYDSFVRFSEAHGRVVPDVMPGLGWYMPFAIRKEDVLPFGEREGYPNDFLLFGTFAARQYNFLRVRSYAYHFQKMSG